MSANRFILVSAFLLSGLVLAGCSKAEKTAAPEIEHKTNATEKAGVTLDAGARARMGIVLAAPAAAQWQPEIKAPGRMLETAPLIAAVADFASVEAAAEVSQKEYDRQKSLAAGNNISTRALEAAAAATLHDQLAVQSARAKFLQDWGTAFTNDNDREKILVGLSSGATALVRLDLPAGENLPNAPASARIAALADETNSIPGTFLGTTSGVNPQTQSHGYFFTLNGCVLLPGTAVAGFIKTAGDTQTGVTVPFDAVLRYEGVGWVYVESETNQFVRAQIPLDRVMENGWFVGDGISTTNHVVVTGAQSVLSTELSQGGFSTGGRD